MGVQSGRLRWLGCTPQHENAVVDTSRPARTQGTLMKRHGAKLAGGAPLRPADLAVGSAVTVCGRAFHLVDADGFTRAWLAARGAPAAGPVAYPEGTIEARARHRREVAAGAGFRVYPNPRPRRVYY